MWLMGVWERSPAGLAVANARVAAPTALAARGARLILDYVPNHVAPDHAWVTSDPERFLQGDEHDIGADPSGWTAAARKVLPTAATHTSRPGPTWCNATRSRQPCEPRRGTRWQASPHSAMASGATWPC